MAKKNSASPAVTSNWAMTKKPMSTKIDPSAQVFSLDSSTKKRSSTDDQSESEAKRAKSALKDEQKSTGKTAEYEQLQLVKMLF